MKGAILLQLQSKCANFKELKLASAVANRFVQSSQ